MFNKKTISINIDDPLIKRMDKAIKQYPGIYDNVSHFIRVAIYKELHRAESGKLKGFMEVD